MVQTWKTGDAGDEACETEGCGAVYAVTIHRFPMRDSDSFNCQRCGKQLASWNSTSVPMFKLKSAPKEPFVAR